MLGVSGKMLAGTLVVALGAPGAMGQSVQMRLVERRGQVAIVPGSTSVLTDNILDYSVQARVVGGALGQGIRSLAFDVVAPCERDVWGTLTRERISNADGTYSILLAVNNTVGFGGLSAPYCSQASIDPNANGMVNATGGGHTNNVNAQDIGSVRALTQGAWMLKVVDMDGNGVPDTSPFNAAGSAPEGAVAPLDAAVGETFFGADGLWVDVYRFRYTRLFGEWRCPYVLEFQIVPIGTPTLFSQMQKIGGAWEAVGTPATGISVTGVTIGVCLGGTICKADHDVSGVLDIEDVFVFVSDWFGGCIDATQAGCGARTADFNCDGVLTVTDIFDFLTRWFQGC